MSARAVCPFCGDSECYSIGTNQNPRLYQTGKCRDLEMSRITERIQRLEDENKTIRAKLEAKP